MDEGKEVLNQEKKAKISENKKDLKLELLCPTCGDKYLATKESQHTLTDKHKNASAGEGKNNENIILLNSQTIFPVKPYRINSTVQNTID